VGFKGEIAFAQLKETSFKETRMVFMGQQLATNLCLNVVFSLSLDKRLESLPSNSPTGDKFRGQIS